MEIDDLFRLAAKAINDLINQRPWSPTIDEITQIIEEEWWLAQALEKDGERDQVDNAHDRRKALRRRVRSFLDT